MKRAARVVAVVCIIALIAGIVMSTSPSKAASNVPKNFVKVTYLMLGDPPTNGQLEKVSAEWNKILKKKVNANLELKFTGWADWYTKYNMMLASGEALDLITSADDWLDLWPNAARGAFLPLDNLLPKYAPITWKSVPQSHWKLSKYNGKIITIPEDQYTQYVNHGFFYRGDWAKEFGIKLPIKDFETFEKYLDGIKKNKPGVIPWDAAVSIGQEIWGGWVESYTDAVGLPFATGYHAIFWGKSWKDRYTIYSPIFDKTFVEYAKTMKRWSDKGYFRSDVLTYKGDTRAELQEGKTGADEHHTATYLGLRPSMDKKQPGSDLQFFAWCDTRGNLLKTSILHGATSVGRNSKNPERALMVYDLIRNDQQIYRLVNYGIEGVQYVLKKKNGVLVRATPPKYDDNKDGFWSNFWGGRNDKLEIPGENTPLDIKNEIYNRYAKIAKDYPYTGFTFDPKPIQAELAALSNVTNTYGPAISFGKVKDPVKAVEDYRKKLKAAGYDKALKEIKRQLLQFKKQMGD
ncbi:ABC transporter substrate-binding protein [Caldicellulosiruptoraceae bacterium PP1]